jgi:sortase A
LCAAGIATVASGAAIPLKTAAAQILLKKSYARSLETKMPQKPPVWADMRTVGRITVPHLGVDRIVLDAGSIEAMRVGPTLMPGSADIGASGTSVLAAHRDTHFRFLKDVKTGDKIIAAGKDGVDRRYRVTRTEIVRWDRFVIAKGQDDNELALTTCYPFNSKTSGPLRFVVHAVQMDS